MDAVKKSHGVLILKLTAYKAKQATHEVLYGSMFDHYSKLERYIKRLKSLNPGSSFIVQTNPEIIKKILVFQMMFIDGLQNGHFQATNLFYTFMVAF